MISITPYKIQIEFYRELLAVVYVYVRLRHENGGKYCEKKRMDCKHYYSNVNDGLL